MSAPGQGAGQDDIFREVLKLQGLIRTVLARYGVPDADVPDLAQDVLVTAHRRITEGAFCPPDLNKPLRDSVAAWLCGIARNLANNHRCVLATRARVSANDSRYYRIDLDALMVASPEEPLLAREQLQVFARLKLTAGQRKAVALAGLGFTAPEIAGRMRIPVNTVFTWLRRVRLAWRKARQGR